MLAFFQTSSLWGGDIYAQLNQPPQQHKCSREKDKNLRLLFSSEEQHLHSI